MVIFGIHGNHGDQLGQSLADLSWLSRKFPRNAKRVFFGDWNVDQLPTFQSDPFCHLPNRSNHHFERRCLLAAWAESLSVSLHLPDFPLSSPGGTYDQFCLTSFFTRVPIGDQEGVPSVIDYAFADSGVVVSSSLDWQCAPADHAIIAYKCRAHFHVPIRRKRFWQPCCKEQVFPLMSNVHLATEVDVSELLQSVRIVQRHAADQRTCKERRVQCV